MCGEGGGEDLVLPDHGPPVLEGAVRRALTHDAATRRRAPAVLLLGGMLEGESARV